MNTLNIAIESAKLLCEDLQRTIDNDDRTHNPVYADILLDELKLARSIRQKLERCESQLKETK